MHKSLWSRWRASFLTGLAVLLPAVISVAVTLWLFGTLTNITDLLLFFLPRRITHQAEGTGPVYWYWSLVAVLVAVLLISAVGTIARHYIGKRLIGWVDNTLLRIPLLNKVYGTIKQVNDAFTSGRRNSFKTVVLVEFPREGIYSIGFITSDRLDEVQQKTREHVVCVFVPTTPNPTSGFLVLVPENKLVKLEMSVADGIRFIISLGSVSPAYPGAPVPSDATKSSGPPVL